METTRRSFLLGSASLFALAGAGGFPKASAPLPVDPPLDAITGAVRSVMDLISKPGLIGLDFCDIDAAVLRGGGKAVCGVGEAEGPNRARLAAERALADLRRIHG